MNSIDAVTPAEISRAAAMFGTMKQLRIQLKSADEESLDRAFESHVNSVLQKLDERLPSLAEQSQDQGVSENQARQMMAVEVIMAKHGLYDAAFQQVVMLCQTISPGFGECVRELRSTHSTLLSEMQQAFCEVANENSALSKELVSLQREHATASEDVADLQGVVHSLNTENEDYKKRVLELRKSLREAAQQIKYLKEAVTADPKAVAHSATATAANTPLNSTLASFNHAYMTNTLNFEDPSAYVSPDQQSLLPKTTSAGNVYQAAGLQRTRSGSASRGGRSPDSHGASFANNSSSHNLNQLQAQNHSHNASSNRLRRTGSTVSNMPPPPPSPQTAAANPEWNPSTKDATIRDDWMNDNASLSVTSTSPSRLQRTSSGANITHKGGLSIVAPVNWLLLFRAEVQKALDEGRCREMTLNEVTETIQKLYQSKVIANEKAGRGIGNVPMETMEQHVFRTYETKYGLRSIAVEHAGALVRSLLLHSAADNEVMVFLKIFRNELEEDFRFIQSELFNSIKDLALVQLMSRYPNKDTAAMNVLLEQKMNGTIYEDEWTDMTNYLYNPADSTTLCVMLRKLAGAEKAKVGYFDSPSGVTKVPLTVNSNAKIVRPNTAYVLESAVGNSSAPAGYDKRNARDVKRLGYSSPTLQITVKENYADARKSSPKLPFKMFLRTVLDFQLQSHLQYLQNFVRVFREMDQDVDGVISAADFRECFLMIRRGTTEDGVGGAGGGGGGDAASVVSKGGRRGNGVERTVAVVNEVTDADMALFLQLITECDPMQTDRVTFSCAVTCLSKMKPL